MKEKKHLNALQTLNSIVLGINSILSQILFVKIWLSVFMGNEIALGIFFAFWAVFILAGSFTGRFFPERTKNRIFFVAVLNLIFILLLFAEFFLLYKIRASFIPGTMVDPVNMLIFGLMIFPSNFILGLTFTYLASFKNALTSEKIYFFESIGFLSAGLLYSFLMAVLFNNFQIFIILAFINIISSSLSFFNCIKKSSAFILLISFLFIFLIYRSDKIYKVIISKNIPGYELMQVKDSFYGSLWTVKKDDQYSILKNNLPVINSDNYPFSEEFIGWSLGFANNPREILIIGFQPDFFSEIDKFNVKTADIVETDREMINMMNKNFPEKYLQYLFNDKVIFHFTDPLYYIKTTSKKYDSVILNLPEITDISVNKLFTEEFFTYIKNILTDNGIFAFNITSSESFLEKDLKERNNSVYKTLKPVFNNILIINGERNIFISSKNNSCKLSAENISGNLNKRKIKNKFFTQRYINYRLNKYNQDFINTVYNNSDKTIPYNKVLKPVLYQMETVVWSSYFSASLKNMALIFNKYGFLLYPFFFILALALIISGKKVNILSGLSMSAGLNMMTLELIIIYLFQVHIGSLYSQIGAITAVFMLGSALGVLVEKKINSGSDNKKGISFSMILMSFVAVFLFSYSYANIINVLSGYIFLISLNLLTGLSGGMFFSSAVRNEDKNTSALIYSMDTLGAGIGSLITLSSLICRAGVNNSCLMIFTSLFILLVIIRMKKYR